jgi:hypothetical protein
MNFYDPSIQGRATFTSSRDLRLNNRRLCDGDRGVWLISEINEHMSKWHREQRRKKYLMLLVWIYAASMFLGACIMASVLLCERGQTEAAVAVAAGLTCSALLLVRHYGPGFLALVRGK